MDRCGGRHLVHPRALSLSKGGKGAPIWWEFGPRGKAALRQAQGAGCGFRAGCGSGRGMRVQGAECGFQTRGIQSVTRMILSSCRPGVVRPSVLLVVIQSAPSGASTTLRIRP